MKNQQIAVVTAGILAAGLMLVASLGANVMAASSSASGSFLGNVGSNAAAAPGQSGSSSFAWFQGFSNVLTGTNSAASDTGVVGTSSGAGIACGNGVNAQVGACSQANP